MRVINALKRKNKIKWLRSLGGKAAEVARGGVKPSVAYGDATVGLPPRALSVMRRIQGAASSIKAGGASLTTKLALGGEKHGEADPGVTDPNPPLRTVLELLWDRPQTRADFVITWQKAAEEFRTCSEAAAWRLVRGPVSGAWAHMKRIGVHWAAPFRITILAHDVDILRTPPKQVMSLMKAHARRHYDLALVASVAQRSGCSGDDIVRTMDTYRHGIQWNLVRECLNNKNGRLDAVELRAMKLVITDAMWTEDRRWRAGMRGEGSCQVCLAAIGTKGHHLHECDGTVQHMTWRRVAGSAPAEPKANFGWEHCPLLLNGLPPKLRGWTPALPKATEGGLADGIAGIYYGDGSGKLQGDVERRVASWALWLPSAEAKEEVRRRLVRDRSACQFTDVSYCRNTVSGWHPTVPRGELTAVLEFVCRAGANSTYVGDCKTVLDIVADRVPSKFCSSWSADADLWRQVKRRLEGRMHLYTFRRTAAHRSRGAAEAMGAEEVADWEGNDGADELAKSMTRMAAVGMTREAEEEREDEHRRTLERISIAAGWVLKRLPDADPKRKKLPRIKSIGAGDSTCIGEHHVVPRLAGGLVCTRCRLHAATPTSIKSLRLVQCRGSIAGQCHPSHRTRFLSGVTWCQRCGAYASKRPRTLRAPCAGMPTCEARRNVIRRMRAGLMPTTARYLQGVIDEAEHEAAATAAAGGGTAEVNSSSSIAGIDTAASGTTSRMGGGGDDGGDGHGLRGGARHGDGHGRSGHDRHGDSHRRGGHYHPREGDEHGDDDGHRGDHRPLDDDVPRLLAGPPLPHPSGSGRWQHVAEPSRRIGGGGRGGGTPAFAAERSRHGGDAEVHAEAGDDPLNSIAERERAGAISETHGRDAIGSWCSPAQGTAWTRRTVISHFVIAKPCNVCASVTRASCRGCQQPLCLGCARTWRGCGGPEVVV